MTIPMTIPNEPIERLARIVLLSIILLGASNGVSAQTAPSQCDDLDGIAATAGVDFASQIQPIFSSLCSGCHGQNGAAGMDLRAGQAYASLVGVQSTTNPDRLRVQPFDPDASVLMAAINCAAPGGPSFQMPGTDLQQRALIRDWIAQGALSRPAPTAVPAMGVPGVLLLLALAGLFGLAGLVRRVH